MSIHVDDLRNHCGLLGELAADEIEDLEKAFALLFAENAKLRASRAELLEAVDALLSNEERAVSGSRRPYQKGSPTWQIWEDLRNAAKATGSNA